jgi:hypothetical protein
MGEEHQGDAQGDQDGAEEECKTHSQENAQRALAFFPRNALGERSQGTPLVAEHGAKNIYVGNDPEFDFPAGLPEEIASGTDDQNANDAEKLGHG